MGVSEWGGKDGRVMENAWLPYWTVAGWSEVGDPKAASTAAVEYLVMMAEGDEGKKTKVEATSEGKETGKGRSRTHSHVTKDRARKSCVLF